METCEHLEDEIIDSCQFCGQEETIKKAIIIARSATGPVLHKAMPDDNLTPGERYKLGLITETELLIFNREWREIESIQMKQRINGAPYESK